VGLQQRRRWFGRLQEGACPADISVDHVDSAQRFLTYLRACHGAEPGKVFQLALKSMGQKNVIRGWGYKRFLAARRALQRAGLLEQVRKPSTGRAALYKLLPMRLHTAGRSK
jgi:hypothetical protein